MRNSARRSRATHPGRTIFIPLTPHIIALDQEPFSWNSLDVIIRTLMTSAFAMIFEEISRVWMGLAGILGTHTVLCDVLDDTLCIDPEAVQALLSPRTKAVMPLDYGSSLYDAPALNRVIDGRHIRVVHDAARSDD